MNSASHAAFAAPVGRPQPAAGRHTRAAAPIRISCRRPMGKPRSWSERPSRSSRSAPRFTSSRNSLGQPSPAASRRAVASCAAALSSRGTISLSTAGVPSSHVASATNASVESRYGRPTASPQSSSMLRTSGGSASSQAPAPTASAFSRTTGGTSINRRRSTRVRPRRRRAAATRRSRACTSRAGAVRLP